MSKKVSVFWFRRDLRLEDNVGFLEALKGDCPVLPIFIFDTEILDKLPKDDARVTFIHETLDKMRQTLQNEHKSSIALFHGKPMEVFKSLTKEYDIKAIYTNHDYEPYARQRDEEIDAFLKEQHIDFKTFKDQVIFEKDEVVKDDGKPYVVYTPFKNKWKSLFNADHLTIHYTSEYMDNLIAHTKLPNLSLSDMGFSTAAITVPDYTVTPTLVQNYEDTSNFPAKENGTPRV